MAAQGLSIDFASIIASYVHDMKNSLGLLLNTLDDIGNNCDLGRCREIRRFMELQYEVRRVNNDLIQMLALYKMGNRQYCLNISEHQLDEFMEEIVMQHEPLLNQRGIEIETAGPDGLFGFFDRDLVAGVINNVINNAYRYAKDKIRLSANKEDSYLVIRIVDNGRGYPENMLARQAEEGTGLSFNTGSTGLGLYFASLVARMHRDKGKEGFVTRSNDGINGGGCFTMHLP